LPILLAASLIASFVPFDRILNLSSMSNNEAVLLFCLVLLQLWMNTLRSTFSVVICAKGHYSWVFATEGVVRLTEMLLIVVALLAFDARPVTVAAISCATTVLDFLIIMRLRRGLYDWARIDLRAWDSAWLKSLVRPSVGFWLSNLTTQSIMLQGPRVALGIVLGGEAVAIYSVFATVNRLTDQLVMLFSWPLQIEVAQSSQRQEFGQAYRLVTFATQVAWLLFIGAAAGLMLLGPSLFPYWTAGKIEFDHGLMALFLVNGRGCADRPRQFAGPAWSQPDVRTIDEDVSGRLRFSGPRQSPCLGVRITGHAGRRDRGRAGVIDPRGLRNGPMAGTGPAKVRVGYDGPLDPEALDRDPGETLRRAGGIGCCGPTRACRGADRGQDGPVRDLPAGLTWR
jgi:hypothetical protein